MPRQTSYDRGFETASGGGAFETANTYYASVLTQFSELQIALLIPVFETPRAASFYILNVSAEDNVFTQAYSGSVT